MAAGLPSSDSFITPCALRQDLSAMWRGSCKQAVLAWCQRVIVTSTLTARTIVAEFGVLVERVTAAMPGVDPAPITSGSPTRRSHLLGVDTLTSRKGHRLLLKVLMGMLDLDWALVCVGSAERNPTMAAQIRVTSPCWG